MTEQELNLSPTRPYLARAIYEWICDNQLTPHLLVNATHPQTIVPEQFVQDGQIVLNIAPHAVHQFHMSNEAITFSARFSGVSRELYVPIEAVLGLYARENGQGLFFDPAEYPDTQIEKDTLKSAEQETTDSTKKKPSLRLLD
ncbi:ClpXP protease specificity-enhancing factor [Acinetobacter radioresistens]|uniref:ClpXP protease specificity-enhancing factor n=1 Tax=Acinetobacter radioresistens TaxID=40216 RepID=UPI000C329488|nr:ClpXP protease specificity-enhancing factor [Acinetobacter radioresistens]MCM1936324.1 ClpXP protease specificity-enhancing factor [Acinetobacter radioresistens]MCM1954042.1 ClpXP protease specificity-enhancing factor [Acinetobacter radioresistens]MCU4309392.1 ClpXP protease specificity-enhancing factor [Acinetobacter radioresistens]MCU4567555.1 ClpXP protease specificity-enhancing factor [Acinetobacter radioresistens]PKH30318.1 ClpXP protease specificity-enhancing factor [Acinetobacter rad